MNFKRRAFLKIVIDALEGQTETIVVAQKGSIVPVDFIV
jgi:hypothetical protein